MLVILNKVISLLRDGLNKLKDIKVQKGERKASSNGKPGEIIAQSIETLEQERTILETRNVVEKYERL